MSKYLITFIDHTQSYVLKKLMYIKLMKKVNVSICVLIGLSKIEKGIYKERERERTMP